MNRFPTQARSVSRGYHAFIKSESGAGIVLRYLLDYPVDRGRLSFGHGTAAKAADKLQSDPVLEVLHQIASNGFCPDDRKALGVVSTATLTREVHKAGGRMMSSEQIAARVDDLVPHAATVRNAFVVDDVIKHVTQDGFVSVRALSRDRQRGRSGHRHGDQRRPGRDSVGPAVDHRGAKGDHRDLEGQRRLWRRADGLAGSGRDI